MEQFTKPVEGHCGGQETAATRGGLQDSGCAERPQGDSLVIGMQLRCRQASCVLVFGNLWQEINLIRVSISEYRLKSTARSKDGRPPTAEQNRPHPSGCTSSFPARGLTIGANHFQRE